MTVAQIAEQEKTARRVAEERRLWWRLEEMARRCKLLAERIWDADLQKAAEEQRATAEALRDRHTVGTRVTTGQAYEIDKGLTVPVLTPYDRLVFLEKAAVSYMISADRQNMPVTPEGKRATQKVDATDTVEAGSGVDETDADREQESLAQAGETP